MRIQSFLKRSTLVFSLFALLALTGCSDDDTTQSANVQQLPSYFRMQGEALGEDAQGLDADCFLDFIFELRRETGRSPYLVQYSGIHGGEAFRRVVNDEGAGFGFRVDVYGEVTAELQPYSGYTAIHIPINETAEGRFWQFLSGFEGTFDTNGNGSGKWICAPLDLDETSGYIDNSVIAYGTWTITPITESQAAAALQKKPQHSRITPITR